MELLEKIDKLELTKRRSILIMIILFLMLFLVAMLDNGKYTEQEKQQIENNYKTCIKQDVKDLKFLAC